MKYLVHYYSVDHEPLVLPMNLEADSVTDAIMKAGIRPEGTNYLYCLKGEEYATWPNCGTGPYGWDYYYNARSGPRRKMMDFI